ncbi:hypothetical protein DL96DRAFT_1587659 [Flagelloscypha sp. PMI_526]|nr:hypothetical protein DL96DRAFT_1587659 [Flagelloscypha sp. PMI_526]
MPPEPSASNSRRRKGKSKAGCRNCKARKVKCDETRPICKACSRRKENCVWNEWDDPFAAYLTPAAAYALRIPPERQLAIVPCSSFNMRDLELLHTWSTKTFNSIAPDLPTIRHTYTTLVPELAFRHDTLLHAIFALSALQLHTSNPSSDYLSYAKTHCQKALLGLRQELSSNNLEVGFVTNFVLASYWLSSPSWNPINEAITPNLFDWFPTARRFMVGLTPFWRCVATGHVKDSPFLPHFLVKAALKPSGPSPLPLLRGIHKKETCPLDPEELDDPQTVAVFETVLDALDVGANLALKPLTGIGALYLFPGSCPDEFCNMLQSQSPRALIIMAHFCALLAQFDGTWWYGHDRSKRDLQQILELLDEKWLPWMQYPIDTFKIKFGVDMSLNSIEYPSVAEPIVASSISNPQSSFTEFDMSMSWMAPTLATDSQPYAKENELIDSADTFGGELSSWDEAQELGEILWMI